MVMAAFPSKQLVGGQVITKMDSTYQSYLNSTDSTKAITEKELYTTLMMENKNIDTTAESDTGYEGILQLNPYDTSTHTNYVKGDYTSGFFDVGYQTEYTLKNMHSFKNMFMSNHYGKFKNKNKMDPQLITYLSHQQGRKGALQLSYMLERGGGLASGTSLRGEHAERKQRVVNFFDNMSNDARRKLLKYSRSKGYIGKARVNLDQLSSALAYGPKAPYDPEIVNIFYKDQEIRYEDSKTQADNIIKNKVPYTP